MPELPEVETVARGLQKAIAARRILGVTLRKTDFIDNPQDIERELPGCLIRAVERYGKFLLLRLIAPESSLNTEESALLVHLGMTGMLLPVASGVIHAKHTHVVLQLDDGRELRYIDPRRFGRIAYLTGEAFRKELLRFGSDPLESGLSEFIAGISGRKARIKALLLDQRVLRGVGNIYADESLWRAKIHPARIAASLRKEQVRLLFQSLQKILRQAIALRGSSISDFLDADGQPGEYQLHHQVYGREGKHCFRCKSEIRRGVVGGRSSFYCPNCQKVPRGWKALAIKTKAKPKKKRKQKWER